MSVLHEKYFDSIFEKSTCVDFVSNFARYEAETGLV